MEINLESGKYIVAVSGGVDSVVLLDILSKQKNIELAVAHFDHGIRKDSKSDNQFVKRLAMKYELIFYTERAELGPNASEDLARRARYAFLDNSKQTFGASAIITAHHQDDLLETATFNILRGTGRKGINSLKSTKTIIRPLLSYTKKDLIDYALENKLIWVEDKTNLDTKYARNYIRHKMLAGLSKNSKNRFIDIVNRTGRINNQLDTQLAKQINEHEIEGGLDRYWFIMLPHDVSEEIMAYWLRQNKLGSFDKKTIQRSVIAAKTFQPGKQSELYSNAKLNIGHKTIKINF